MVLNDYRDEAGEFMAAIGAGQEDVSRILEEARQYYREKGLM